MSEMSQCDSLSLHNTPIRREELSITRKSLRSRVLISANSNKETIIRVEGNEMKRSNDCYVLSSTRICENSSIISNKFQEENCHTTESNVSEECLQKFDVTPKENTMDEEYMNSFSSDSCDSMETSIIHQQKHSTPQALKYSIKAAASTPNPEMFNLSKFKRNVFTQTNFTSNDRNPDSMRKDLMSYCIEDESECHERSISSSLNITSDLSSPLSHLCTSKQYQEDVSPKNKQLVRKLSLRSKTIICSALEKSKDIPRKIFSRHKSMEEKHLVSNTFSLMPQAKTPPSYTGKVVHNPFEVDLQHRLSRSIFSPDVFNKVVSPSQDSEELRWTIEDISSINPVPIDEDFSIPSDDDDPDRESQVQQEIDRYFSETHIVLSPDDLPKSSTINDIIKSNLHSGTAASTPRKISVNDSKEVKNSSTQTNFSFPPILPVGIEESLKSYFQFFKDEEFNLSQCNLRRKLFFHSEDEPPSPVRFEMKSSPITKDMWKAQYSPLPIICRERHFTPTGRPHELSSPEMSPVIDETSNSKMRNDSMMTCKKTLHDIFLGGAGRIKEDRKIKEAIDCSMVTVSDTDSSSQPASQDTGYNTEDSVYSHLHFSTPTKTVI